MAVELHAADCPNQDDEGVDVAIRQIELAEDYVRRLTMVASGQQDQDRPTDVLTCFDDIRTSLSPIAKHLKVNIQWDNALPGSSPLIQDGPTWVAAVTNLIHNAMQAGDQISVSLSLISDNAVQVRVVDNGPGVNDAIASEIFEPFVTSKPEGMGLGLSVVKRAAEQLGGDARWYRQNESTVFEFESATDSSQETP